MFAERFRVRVDVGPTPVRGAFDTEVRQPCPGPDFSLARDGESECVGIVDVASFFQQPFAGRFAKTRGHHRVARFVSHPIRKLCAIGDLLFDRELDALHFRLVVAREVTDD